MSITWIERPKQQATVEHGRFSSTREYVVSGTYEKVDALQTIAQASPATDIITDLAGNPIAVFRRGMSPRELGGGVWEIQIGYSHTPDQYNVKFNNGTQSTKVLQSQRTVRVYDCISGETSTGEDDGEGGTTYATTNVPDLYGAINVSSEGGKLKVEGTEDEIGKVEFSITASRAFANIDANYLTYLAGITPSVNDDVWSFFWKDQAFVFPRGSVVFRCATTDEGGDTLSIQHNFAYSKPITALSQWDGSATYNTGDRVVNGGFTWISLDDGNSGYEPIDYDGYDSTTTYSAGVIVKYDGVVYQSTSIGNTNNRPDISFLWWIIIGAVHWQKNGNDTTFRIGNSAPIVKEGWEFLHPFYKTGVSQGAIVPVPTGAIISQIKDYSNFNLLRCFG